MKLGYIWYPKDWGNSEKVFELSLSERGLYRELIDTAMINDNETEINIKVWVRKYKSSEDEINTILSTLRMLNLIQLRDNILFIPSCEKRLILVRAGGKGGRISKPIPKPIPKPIESLVEKNEKPIPKQKKRKEIEIESKVSDDKNDPAAIDKFLLWFNEVKIQQGLQSNVKSLSHSDRANLATLKKSYSKEDFRHALNCCINDPWAKESNQIIPSHFLKPDNFIKYLNTIIKPAKSIWINDRG